MEWTRDEIRDLRKMYKNSSNADCADVLNRSVDSIRKKAYKLGLRKTKKYLKGIR